MKGVLGFKSAYGQLVVLIFLPIAVLASAGGILVFVETTRAVESEQDVLAQAALIRYEPIIHPLLPHLKSSDQQTLQQRIDEFDTNGMTDALLPSPKQASTVRRHMTDSLYRIQSEQHVKRVGVLDGQGEPIWAVGYRPNEPWGAFDVQADGVWRQKTNVGTAYGMPMSVISDGVQHKFWLFVDMDNEPLIIARYRILLALAITGLITMLLLLLILNMYSKRWISPIYEMRLHLQKVNIDNLGKMMAVRSDGEFYLLQKELNLTLKRLGLSVKDLRVHSQETEADLRLAFDEMEMQNITIRQAKDTVVKASEAKSAFLANISHELRTPLNAIDGFINLLARDGGLDAKQALYVQTIKKSSAHLLALISDVLDFSKIEAGKLVLDSEPFDLYDILYEVADMLSPTAFDKGLRLAVMYYWDVPTCMVGDKLRVKQIITNLLGNAIKFTDTGGITIKVAPSDKEGFITIAVSDTGRGIGQEVQNELFKNFGQGDLSITRRYGGTGLGLAISKQLTTLMKGKIGFYDNAAHHGGQGATFWFSLPVDETAQLSEIDLPPLKVLAWISHEPSFAVLKASLFMEQVQITQARSLAHLLEILATGGEYDWVIVDSFGQQGDATALLRQVRLHFAGRLAVFGYEIALDKALLAQSNAHALYEPLDRKNLYELLLDTQPAQKQLSVWQGVQVLAVDDHLPNLLVLEALLSELGVVVTKAESGFVAIDKVNDSIAGVRFDLIFMDISMPSMSGLQAATAIRGIETAHGVPAVPIIALSAHGLWEDMQMMTKAGIDEYATKPICYDDLVYLLEKWLPDSRAVLPPPYAPKALPVLPSKTKPFKTDKPLVIDWADALERSANKPDLAKKLLVMLQKSLKNDRHELETAWQKADKQALTDITHRLVGATRYAGVPELRTSAQAFYDKCLSGQFDCQSCQNDYQKLMEAIKAVQQANLP